MTRISRPLRLPQLLLLLLTSLFASSALQAAPAWYEIEIIVFAHARESYRDSEYWKQDLPQPQFDSARILTPPGSAGGGFQALDPSRYRLQGEWNRLQNSSEYRPLLHTAWRQPGLSREQAVGVLVESGAASATLGGAKPLSGVIKVGLSRYLHLDANLLYRLPRKAGAEGKENEVPFDTFQLSESRRMRSKEIHYLDHPMFGVIALITPL
ncbi:MAG TPA: CsiV family protein [Gammaproteobacteria bacterium]